MFLALAAGTDGSPGAIAFRLVAEEIGIGLVVGVGLAVAGHRAIRAAADRGWIDEPWTQLPVSICIGLSDQHHSPPHFAAMLVCETVCELSRTGEH